MATPATLTPSSSYLAGSLLRAWAHADLSGLQTELAKSARVPISAVSEGEEERLELLQTVAAWMRTCPTLLAPESEDPGLDICVDLLIHLSGLISHSD